LFTKGVGRRFASADARGESSPHTNLSNADIIEIRMLADSGVQKKKIAAIFGVTPSAISRITRGNRWGHIA
jgi:hypothetical protein